MSSAEGASDSGCAQAALLTETATMKAGKTERCIDLTLALNSSDELHYKRKATPNGKQKLPRAVLARPRARFVALKFILRKRRLVMVNAGFRFATPPALFSFCV
jgi:hypothetical protein